MPPKATSYLEHNTQRLEILHLNQGPADRNMPKICLRPSSQLQTQTFYLQENFQKAIISGCLKSFTS